MCLGFPPPARGAQEIAVFHGGFPVTGQMGAQQLRFGLLEPPQPQCTDTQQTPFTGRQVCLTLQIGDELLVLALLEES
ncbi:hypothetical protein BXU09_17450 [Deinococcus sp. LM3]|nr:hypothetical protein BXU09_17450 [Deinococcus sp. LM3]